MRIDRRLAALLFPILLGSRCAVVGAGDEPRTLREARERWEAAGIADYTLDLQRICFCGSNEPVRLVVRAGAPVSYTVIATGAPLPAEERRWFPTVPGLFEFLEDAIERNADRIEARYDPGRGYPLELFVDYDDRTADEEMGYEVRAFTAQ